MINGEFIAPELNREEQSLLSKVRLLCKEHVAKNAARVDKEGRFPEESIEILRREGLLALGVPQEQGGLASRVGLTADLPLLNRIYLEIAKACSSTSQVLFIHTVAAKTIFEFGGEQLKRLMQKEIIEKGTYVTAASSEPGRTVADYRTAARPVDGGYTLHGTKHFCTGHEGARYLKIAAVIEGASTLEKGLLRCVVPIDQPGIILHHDWDAMGQRGTSSGTITLEGVFVPQSHVLAREEPTSLYKLFTAPVYQTAFSAIYVGIAEAALEAALGYIRTETRPWPTAGADKAVDDPLIQWNIGDLVVQLEAAKLLLMRASNMVMESERGRAPRGQVSIMVAQAKVASTRAALEITNRMFQLCGARSSYSRYGFDRYWRNARTLTLHDPVDQKLREIGKFAVTGEDPLVWFYS